MHATGFGDLAASYRGSLQSTRIKTELARLSDELASGQKSDLSTGAGGDLARYAAFENTLNALSGYGVVAREASLLAETMQASLGFITDLNDKLGPDLIWHGQNGTDPAMGVIANEAREGLETVISSLNTRVADRALFSGTGTDRAALADADTILTSLQTAITTAGATTDTDIIAAVDDWFDAVGGGFETVGYLGEATDLAPLRIGRDEDAEFELRADSTSIRDVLKGYTLAALVADGAVGTTLQSRSNLLQEAGARLIAGNDALHEERADLGATQERIERATAKNAAEATSLELARTNLLAADPFTAATELQAAELQLQSLFTLTGRLSSLSLVNFL